MERLRAAMIPVNHETANSKALGQDAAGRWAMPPTKEQVVEDELFFEATL